MIDSQRFALLMPKAELHIHLEGAIHPATLLKLAERNGISLPARDEEGLRDFYRFRNFNHFVEVYVTITGCLRTPEDFRLIAYQFGHDCALQNILYAEATFTITTNMQLTGLPWQAILDGLNDGRRQARDEYGVDWRWIFDINRNHPETQALVLEIVHKAREMGVIALGLGGSEMDYPADLFRETFNRAVQLGIHRVPHAGETAGPESVWAALKELHAERIGHGVRSIEDPDLISYLKDKQIPLEVCPTSNLRLGLYDKLKEHPLRQLWDLGLWITVNSDDPPMFGTDLNKEYQILVDEFGFTINELMNVSLNAIHASFLSDEEKASLEKTFQSEFDHLSRSV